MRAARVRCVWISLRGSAVRPYGRSGPRVHALVSDIIDVCQAWIGFQRPIHAITTCSSPRAHRQLRLRPSASYLKRTKLHTRTRERKTAIIKTALEGCRDARDEWIDE